MKKEGLPIDIQVGRSICGAFGLPLNESITAANLILHGYEVSIADGGEKGTSMGVRPIEKPCTDFRHTHEVWRE